MSPVYFKKVRTARQSGLQQLLMVVSGRWNPAGEQQGTQIEILVALEE